MYMYMCHSHFLSGISVCSKCCCNMFQQRRHHPVVCACVCVREGLRAVDFRPACVQVARAYCIAPNFRGAKILCFSQIGHVN